MGGAELTIGYCFPYCFLNFFWGGGQGCDEGEQTRVRENPDNWTNRNHTSNVEQEIKCPFYISHIDQYLMSSQHSNKALVEDGGFTQN